MTAASITNEPTMQRPSGMSSIQHPTTSAPTTYKPTTQRPTSKPTAKPSTQNPTTKQPSTTNPTRIPTPLQTPAMPLTMVNIFGTPYSISSTTRIARGLFPSPEALVVACVERLGLAWQ
jgi:hypothetical protein